MHGILADHQIRELNLVSPLQEQLLQPASVDVTLGYTAAILNVPKSPNKHMTYIGSVVGEFEPDYTYHADWDQWTLRPGSLVLFETAETLTLPIDIMGRFDGKSSLGRIGLMTHVSAGFIDPGYSGVLTLEVYNCGPLTLILKPGIRIGQVSFAMLGAIPERAYGHPTLGSHYQGAERVRGAEFS